MSDDLPPQSLQNAQEVGKQLWLGLALEDALADLVAAHGIGYLDTFLERRVRRTTNATQHPMRERLPADMQTLLRASDSAMMAAGREALTNTIENVRRDPSQVT